MQDSSINTNILNPEIVMTLFLTQLREQKFLHITNCYKKRSIMGLAGGYGNRNSRQRTKKLSLSGAPIDQMRIAIFSNAIWSTPAYFNSWNFKKKTPIE